MLKSLIKALAVTFTITALTIYGPLELSRFIQAFYGFFGFWDFLAEFWVMWLAYGTGILLVFLLAYHYFKKTK